MPAGRLLLLTVVLCVAGLSVDGDANVRPVKGTTKADRLPLELETLSVLLGPRMSWLRAMQLQRTLSALRTAS